MALLNLISSVVLFLIFSVNFFIAGNKNVSVITRVHIATDANSTKIQTLDELRQNETTQKIDMHAKFIQELEELDEYTVNFTKV